MTGVKVKIPQPRAVRRDLVYSCLIISTVSSLRVKVFIQATYEGLIPEKV